MVSMVTDDDDVHPCLVWFLSEVVSSDECGLCLVCSCRITHTHTHTLHNLSPAPHRTHSAFLHFHKNIT